MAKRGREEKRGPARQFDDRQARKQADRLENDVVEGDFNIWYGPRKKRRGKDKAPARCDPGFDAGVTRGSEAGALEFCIFFARGACARGYSCHKLHFVPTQEDDAREDNMHDCFGRERSGVEDDDRDGVGCFLKENRTLWVGGVPVFDEAAARERVRQNFGAWGRISSVRLVKNKSCAFVQFAYRANAEFAKEAMSNQALLTTEQMESSRATAAAAQGRIGKGAGPRRPPSSSAGGSSGGGGGAEDGPVLHVRWAAEDPNPRAVIRAREGHAQTLLAAQVATGALPGDVTGRLPGADRALLRKTGMGKINPSQVDLEFQNTQRQYLAVQGHAAGGGLYPSTDHQYPSTDRPVISTDYLYPNTDHQYSSTDYHYPSTDHQYPNTDHQYPNTDHQYPNTDDRYPSTDHQYPGAASAASEVGVAPPSSVRGEGTSGAKASPPSAPAGGAPDEAIEGASGSLGCTSSGDSANAKGLRGGGAGRSHTATVTAAGEATCGGGTEAVAGGSLSLLGGYGSENSD